MRGLADLGVGSAAPVRGRPTARPLHLVAPHARFRGARGRHLLPRPRPLSSAGWNAQATKPAGEGGGPFTTPRGADDSGLSERNPRNRQAPPARSGPTPAVTTPQIQNAPIMEASSTSLSLPDRFRRRRRSVTTSGFTRSKIGVHIIPPRVNTPM